MIEVYQTLIDNQKGNCMQAAIASLFELPLEEVPNFIESPTWFYDMIKFFRERGYDPSPLDVHRHTEEGLIPISSHNIELVKECLKYDGGVRGYFFASTPSKIFEYPTTHAVVIDCDLNIVHDVSPRRLCLGLGAESIISVVTTKGGWYIQDEKLIKEAW